MRLSFVGELGWELHASNSAALDIYDALFKAGKELGLKNSGYRAMDSLSMEKGRSLIPNVWLVVNPLSLVYKWGLYRRSSMMRINTEWGCCSTAVKFYNRS